MVVTVGSLSISIRKMTSSQLPPSAVGRPRLSFRVSLVPNPQPGLDKPALRFHPEGQGGAAVLLHNE